MPTVSKIPNILFYNPSNTNLYRMFDFKKAAYIGEMAVVKRNDLYIENLNIKPEFRRMGFGRKFLDFAVNLSKQMGLNGNLRVMAGLTTNDLSNSPHIFYRKYGFTSYDKQILNKIDEHIKNHTKPAPYDLPLTIMYYVNNNL